jgi:hypothetical protein
MRFALALAILAFTALPAAHAGGREYRYAPMNALGEGYHDELERDGFWEIEAGIVGNRGVLAIDVAIYRAAELAKSGGHRYVEIHDASERRDRFGKASARLYARPVAAPVHPATCRSGRPRRCYTADTELVFARLSGKDMRHPGVATPSHVDEFGRDVLISGFGTGAVGGSPPL